MEPTGPPRMFGRLPSGHYPQVIAQNIAMEERERQMMMAQNMGRIPQGMPPGMAQGMRPRPPMMGMGRPVSQDPTSPMDVDDGIQMRPVRVSRQSLGPHEQSTRLSEQLVNPHHRPSSRKHRMTPERFRGTAHVNYIQVWMTRRKKNR